MTREEMREKVAEAMKEADRAAAKRGMWKKSLHHDMADAAIAIIRGETLEEAARVIDTRWQHGVGDHYAAAIRALKDKQ